MIDTDRYEGHLYEDRDCDDDSLLDVMYFSLNLLMDTEGPEREATAALMADAPLLLEAYKRLRDELDKQMGYIEWLEEFAPKAGEYNTSWEAYELAKESEEE